VPELERLPITRVVAKPSALDGLEFLQDSIAIRIAPDEMLLVSGPVPHLAGDPHAIIEPDTGFSGMWLPIAQARAFLARTCEWELPRHAPAFAQGSVAGLPVKLWFEADRVLFLVPAPYAHDFEERLS
jgi:hypothetical protein